ncbi:hypothetical protein [Wolbachia endosymbiont of Mansonella perstans]|uniref:hypothetical protein n=1 Tax=Wolbachia endosymbiont of Mansonella perstans TaxID=229526 RepID=UPI001CE17356|nr:hypothetical protein [Wolbachia endosymbiont of Mansonella perstans]MCA4773979.1 hypothetical protein [Wolbachia endosymbiont of Mansonella perstans]
MDCKEKFYQVGIVLKTGGLAIKLSQVSNIDSSKNETPEEPGISANEPDSAKSEPVIGSICENQKGVPELLAEINYTDKNFGVI